MGDQMILGISVVFALFFMITPVFAEHYETKHATSYSQVGNPITISDSVKNPTNQTVNASIEFVFENIEGDNYWDTKQHSGEASVNKSYGTNQAYFIDDVGRFFISIIKKIDGNVVETSKTDFIVFEEYSDAALNGCSADHELVVKQDYSQAVCVFDESVIKLVQRGWIAKTIFSHERIIEHYKDKPEVVAFYDKYPNANEEVRSDHVSYFVGSDDGFKVRMNLYFDENFELDYINLKCYLNRELQNDVAGSFISKYLKDYTCDEKGSQKTRNIQIRGDMADQICSVIYDECPSYFIGNMQEDGSIIVLITSWDADTKTEKQFTFIIKNDTLSYDVTTNEN